MNTDRQILTQNEGDVNTGFEVIFFMLISAEHETYPAHKCGNFNIYSHDEYNVRET